MPEPAAPFEFATAGRIVFGRGLVTEAIPAARQMGSRALLVTGKSGERTADFEKSLADSGLQGVVVRIEGEPTVPAASHAAQLASDAGCDVVIALGGGSAIDAGKAIAAFLTNRSDPLDYLEVIGRGRALEHPPAPWIAIPTTAGTGAEVTRNAVLASPKHRLKVSLRSPLLLARAAIVDPELTCCLPPQVTATSGLDALTQLMEAYVSVRANPLTDSFCRDGLPRAARALLRAFQDGSDMDARTDLAIASLLSGLALANAGLGAVHGFAGPIGGMFTAPHGAVCAALLPHATRVNIEALQKRQPGGEALRRYETIAQTVTGNPHSGVGELYRWLSDLCGRLLIPGLRKYGVRDSHAAELCAGAARASSMKGNPIGLTNEELKEILLRSL
jgi:alcohol dehydrogenase class IV